MFNQKRFIFVAFGVTQVQQTIAGGLADGIRRLAHILQSKQSDLAKSDDVDGVEMKYVEQAGGCGRILSPQMTKIRCFERTAYERAVFYRMIESVSGYEGLGRTENFSLGGVLFESRERIEETALMEIRIPTRDGVAIADAVVVFVNPIGSLRFQVGVKFVRLLPQDRSRLAEEARNRNRRVLRG